jgi:hypothetical protein
MPTIPKYEVSEDPELNALAASLNPRLKSRPFDSLLQKIQDDDEKKRRIEGNLHVGLDFDPAEYARAVRYAAEFGIVPTAAQRDMSFFEKASAKRRVNVDDIVANLPATAGWLEDFDHAAVSHDDIGTLAALERATKDIGSQILQVPQRAMGGLFRAVGGVSALSGALQQAGMKPGASVPERIASFLLNPTASEPMVQGSIDAGKDIRDYYLPLFTDPALQAETTSGRAAEFVGNLAGTMGKAVLSGPLAPLTFGAEAFGESAGSALERGATPGQATAKAVGSGTLNTALAFIPGGKFGSNEALGQAFAAGGKAAIAKEIGRGAAVRVARGTVLGTGVTLAENTLSKATGDENVTPLQGWGENVAAFIGLEGAGYLSHAMALAHQSKLKERAPEAFQAAAERILKNTGAEEVLIPADRFQTFFQEAGLDPAKVAEGLGARNYVEALAAGTDLILPTADALAKLSAEHLEGLKPDLRLKSDAMTPREAATYYQDTPARVAKLVEGAKGELPESEFQAFQTIKNEIQARLEATGRFSPALAEDNAALVAKGLVTKGIQESMDPLKILEGYGLRITGPEAPLPEGQTFSQPGEARGSITFGPDNQVSISVLEKSNASTFVHELGHFWLKMQADLAGRPEASEQAKADMGTLLQWMGVESPDQITTAHHEQFARSHEAYLREGKAPTPELQGTFTRFKVWLQAIYRRLQDLRVNLSDEVRGVFDRIYASDAELHAARQRLGEDKPLFDTAEKAGMTEAQFKDYQTARSMEHETAKASLDSQLAAEADRTKLQWWKDELGRLREEVAPQIDAEPEQRAFKALSEGSLEDGTWIKLSKDSLVRQFGEDAVKDLPRLGAKWVYSREGGIDAEAAAELLGFDSGPHLVEALRTMQTRESRIQSEAERVMKERHGDLLTGGALADAAVEAVHNSQREARLMTELKALRRKQKAARETKAAARAALKDVPNIQDFREAAREIVGNLPIRSLDPYRYMIASRKHAGESFEAMGRDQFAQAGDAKQKEILNHHLFLESTKAKREAFEIFTYGRQGEKLTFQALLGKAGKEYQDQWNALASRYEFRTVTNKELDQRTQSLESWATANAEDGAEIDPSLFREAPPKNWREAPITELQAVRDALKNIETVARYQLEVDLEGIKLNFEKESEAFEESARAANTSKETPRVGTKLGPLEQVSSRIMGLDAYGQKMEWFIDRLDGGDINGPARRNIKKVIDDASGREKAMLNEVNSKLVAVFGDMTREERFHEFDSIGVRFPNMDRDMNRMQLFSWALNLGTVENRNVALLGEGLVSPEGAIRPEFYEALGKLTKKQAERLQGVWDALEIMRPAIIAKERRVKGFEPKWKELTPFTINTADGETVALRGGYYPLKADHGVSNIGKRQMNPTIQEGTFTRPSTSHSHAERVTGATYPLLLDYPSVLSQHLSAVVKDVTAGEAISYASKFIMNEKVSKTIRETIGPEKEKEFLPWLQAFADNGVDGSQSGPIVRFLLSRRSGLVVAKLGGNLTSYLAQGGDSLKLIAAADPALVGKYLPQALYDIRRHPELIEEIRRLSPNEMKFREANFNREIRDMLLSKGPLDATQHRTAEFLMSGFQVMDRIQTYPAWMAKYRQGLDGHGNEAQAVMEADRLVSQYFQAGEPRNMSRMMREPGLMKLFTTFGGDANTWYGILSSAVGNRDVAKVSAALLALIADQMFQSLIVRNRGPQKDKTGEWALEQGVSAVLQPFGVFGDFADYGVKKATGKFAKFNNPTLDAIEKAFALPAHAVEFAQGKREAEALGIDVLEAVGTWRGIPLTGQIVKSWKYQRGLRTGKQPKPDNPLAEGRNTLLGPPPKEQ